MRRAPKGASTRSRRDNADGDCRNRSDAAESDDSDDQGQTGQNALKHDATPARITGAMVPPGNECGVKLGLAVIGRNRRSAQFRLATTARRLTWPL
jgi:hypothetical protein